MPEIYWQIDSALGMCVCSSLYTYAQLNYIKLVELQDGTTRLDSLFFND